MKRRPHCLVGDLIALKRTVRYLLGTRCLVLRHEADLEQDWAGCVKTRRTTSGCGVWFPGCSICLWSRVQQTVVCSSAESQYYSLCSGAAERLFVRALGLMGIKAISQCTSVPTRPKKHYRALPVRPEAGPKQRHHPEEIFDARQPVILTKHVKRSVLERLKKTWFDKTSVSLLLLLRESARLRSCDVLLTCGVLHP